MKMKPVKESEWQPVLRQLTQVIPAQRIAWDEPMSRHTTFQIGGPADALVIPTSEEELQRIILFCREKKLPYYIIGKGSNLLIRDKGIRGAVIKIDQPLGHLEFSGHQVKAGAGLSLGELSRKVAERGLSGLEFAIGIPGSLGGALVMNAGAYDGEMKDVVTSVRVLDEKGRCFTLLADQLKFGYRHSILQGSDLIVLEATIDLTPGNPDEIQARMDDYTKRRESRQPLNLPSAGSVFRRPTGYFVGPMIEELGLKGFQVNQAQVSEMHAGFIVNQGQATAEDVITLIKIIQELAKERFGVELVPEIKIIGEE